MFELSALGIPRLTVTYSHITSGGFRNLEEVGCLYRESNIHPSPPIYIKIMIT